MLPEGQTVESVPCSEVTAFYRRVEEHRCKGISHDLFHCDRDECFVGKANGEIIGAVCLSTVLKIKNGMTDGPMSEVSGVYVLQEHRQGGLGYELVLRACQRLIELGRVPIFFNAINSTTGKLLAKLPLDVKQNIRVYPSFLHYGHEPLPDE